MRHLDLRLCPVLCAALLLVGAAAAPAAALASTRAGPSATLDQLTGITGAPCPTSGFWGWRPVGCGQPYSGGYPYGVASANYGYGATSYAALSGYNDAYSGFGGLGSLGNAYSGSGLAAWSGSSYPSSAAWGAGYPGGGYSPSSGYGYGAGIGSPYGTYGGSTPYGYNTNGASPGAYITYGNAPSGTYGSTAYASSGYAGYAIPATATPYLLCTSFQGNQPVVVMNGTSTEGYASCTPYSQ